MSRAPSPRPLDTRFNTPSTGFPDPFAVATINGEQTQTTGVVKKTLNPYWHESFDLCEPPYPSLLPYARLTH